jgi:uncharacterized protein (TIGR02145 family)
MKITKHILLILLFFQAVTINAQKVSNITFRQEQSTIIVYYDLETKTHCKISLFVSTDDGKTWQGPLKKVTGDVGAKIASGNHSITWNVLEEFEELRGDKIKFQVKADAQVRTNTPDIKTVKIGSQKWTVKNLDVSTYSNGDIIPEIKDPKEWANLKTGAWCYYSNDPENGNVYGKLYNWYAVNDPRGLAPEGFHIPSDTEWKILINYLGWREYDFPGSKMKEKGIIHWNSPNYEATNISGFTGLPGGAIVSIYNDNGKFDYVGDYGYWWSSSESNKLNAWSFYLRYDYGNLGRSDSRKVQGFSVRCLKD